MVILDIEMFEYKVSTFITCQSVMQAGLTLWGGQLSEPDNASLLNSGVNQV